MSEKNERTKRRKKPERQHWEPGLLLRILQCAWMTVFTAAKVALGAAATVLFVCIICGFVFVGILGNYLQEDIIPYAEMNLDNYDLDQTSFIYYQDTDGSIKELQEIYTTTDREWASYDEIPEDLINAAIAIEDKRFYEHQGVDWITTSKACVNMFFGGSSQFGGSTITQQLIKNLTQEDGVTVQRKVLEIFRAQQFERRYTKDVIMEWYMNTIYLGQGCYGVKTAAATYFGKQLEDLTTAECASLISITNNPSIFNPYSESFEYKGEMMTGAERNRDRQENTLWSMKNEGWLTEEEYEAALEQEMVFKYGIDDEDVEYDCPSESCTHSGTEDTFLYVDGTYRCPVCGSEVEIESGSDVYSWFVDTVLEDVAKALAEQNGVEWDSESAETYLELIKRGGFHIYSTIDVEVQEKLDAIYTNLDEIPEARSKQQLQSAMAIVDVRTGDLVAISGGVGEKLVFDAFNRATDSMLQTGSSMKPLSVYAPAFEMGVISPATLITDLPFSYEDGVFPRNFDYQYAYSHTILSGVEQSVNTVAVRTLDMIGTQYGFNFAKDNFGISSLTDYYQYSDGTVVSDIDYAPLALGALTEGATVRDMSVAYAALANGGVYREARTFTKVYDSEGNLVIDNTQDSKRILSEKAATYMNYCLEMAAMDGPADISWIDVAGKTGSTSSYKDRWFCGYTAYYAAAVWCGYDTPEEINLVGNTNNPASRLWNKVMEPLHEDKENKELYDFYSMTPVSICLDSGLVATSACTNDVRTVRDGFRRTDSVRVYAEDIPYGYCDKHVEVDYCVAGDGVANVYCSQIKDNKVEKRALVRMTQREIDKMMQANGYGLQSAFVDDSYIYLITEDGSDATFTGLNGNINKGLDYPYKVCTLHTKKMLDQQNEATKPTNPTNPTNPTVGSGGANNGGSTNQSGTGSLQWPWS